MDSNLVFPYIIIFFLSWGLHGLSQETPQTDLVQSLASIFQQVQKPSGAIAQGSTSVDSITCMQKLAPCQPFMHSPSPPTTCCIPLKDMITEESQCLCNVFNNPELLKSVNVTRDEALALPKACGINADISVCKNDSLSSNSSVSSTSTSNASNPSNFSSSSSSSNSNASIRINDGGGAFWWIASFTAIMFSTLYHV